jgi:hypothetical protein
VSAFEPTEDVWTSLVEASIQFLDTDAVYGAAEDRTRAAKVRLESAVNDYIAYQGELSRLPGPLVRRVK